MDWNEEKPALLQIETQSVSYGQMVAEERPDPLQTEAQSASHGQMVAYHKENSTSVINNMQFTDPRTSLCWEAARTQSHRHISTICKQKNDYFHIID